MVVESEKATYDKGYIKLYKMTKNYNWEIKGFEDMDQDTMDKLLDKIKYLNGKMLVDFGEMGEVPPL